MVKMRVYYSIWLILTISGSSFSLALTPVALSPSAHMIPGMVFWWQMYSTPLRGTRRTFRVWTAIGWTQTTSQRKIAYALDNPKRPANDYVNRRDPEAPRAVTCPLHSSTRQMVKSCIYYSMMKNNNTYARYYVQRSWQCHPAGIAERSWR